MHVGSDSDKDNGFDGPALQSWVSTGLQGVWRVTSIELGDRGARSGVGHICRVR